ncbi:MAG: T9SS type A sorting domain-containing protein [Ignavibacteria bacterium]|nr:T9SS type A sorting domain-containing protein [Ignavibacteria bacterium]
MRSKITLLSLALLILSQFTVLSQTVTWSEQASGLVTQLTSVSASSENNAWACGYSGRVLRTIDGGMNWVSVNAAPIPGTLNLHSIFAIDSLTALVAGSGTSSFLFRTSNGGATWQQVFTETGGFINSVQMGNTFAGFMVGDPVGGRWSLWGTTDGGVTWDSSSFYLPQAGSETGYNNSFFFDVSAGVWFGTTNTRVYKTLTLVSWAPQTTTGQTDSYAIWFNNPLIGMTGGTGMLVTSNGGTTWQNTLSPLPGTAVISGITGSGNMYLATRQATQIYITNNIGLTWSQSYNAPAGNFRHITKDRTSGLTFYAVRSNGGISKGQITTGIEPIGNTIPDYYSLGQNYPNPFNPVTNIKFNIPVGNGRDRSVKLIVYDAIGREVKTLVDENIPAGEYEVNFDGSSLASGTYYYTMFAGDFVQTKKMILVK